MKRFSTFLLLLAALSVSGCGYNTIQTEDQAIKAAWAEVLNQYQRRADLIPNIVNTITGETAFEQETLTAVVNARARAGSIQATPELINNPEAFKKFTAAQNELSSALSRLLVVTENYPSLKSNAGFQDLRSQLEGTENRIGIARNKYIKAVQSYNTTIALLQNMLGKMLTGAKEKPQFIVENEATISKPPVVDFQKK
jgi:LemA protein